jgi:hypothetical protein
MSWSPASIKGEPVRAGLHAPDDLSAASLGLGELRETLGRVQRAPDVPTDSDPRRSLTTARSVSGRRSGSDRERPPRSPWPKAALDIRGREHVPVLTPPPEEKAAVVADDLECFVFGVALRL